MSKKRKCLILGAIFLFGAMLAGFAFFVGASRIEVRCSVDASQAFPLEFYFTQDEETAFRERVTVRVPKGVSEVVAKIPVERLRKLRVDFGSAPGVVKIGRLRVCGQLDVMLDWNDFSQKKDIDRYDVKPDGTLVLSSKRNDPYIVYGKALDIGTRRFAGRLFCCLLSFAAFFLGVLIAMLLGVDLWLRRIWNVAYPYVTMPFQREWQSLAMSVRRFLSGLWADKPFLVYMVAILLLGWGFELANFTFTYDDELILYGDSQRGSVGEGRWGAYLLWLLVGNQSVPVVPLVITLVCYSLSYCLIFGTARSEKYFLFPIYVLFPALFQVFSFTVLNPAIGGGYLAASFAICLFFKRSWLTFALGVLTGSLAIGLYQIFALYIVMGIVFKLTLCFMRRQTAFPFKMVMARYVHGLVFLLSTYLTYKTIQAAFQHFMAINAQYVARYNCPAQNLMEWTRWMGLALKKIGRFLFSGFLFPCTINSFKVVMCLSVLILLIWMLLRVRKWHIRFFLTVSSLMMLVLPFGLDAINKNAGIPIRVILVLLPFGIVCYLNVVMRIIKSCRCLYWGAAVLCLICGIRFAWALNQMAFTNYLQNRQDLRFAGELQQRINDLPEYALCSIRREVIPLVIVGNCNQDRTLPFGRRSKNKGKWPDWEVEVVGRSFFAQSYRFPAVMRLYGNDSFIYKPLSKCTRECEAFVETMPIWPLNGSIAWHGGNVIVKFADYVPNVDFHVGKSPRHMISRNGNRVNGFEELVYTELDKSKVLCELTASANDKLKKSRMIDMNANLRANDNPYVVLEVEACFDEKGIVDLWPNNPNQFCRFTIQKAGDSFRLRIPSYFCNGGIRMFVDARTSKSTEITKFRIYADTKYTEHLLELNPELKDSPVLLNGGKM